MGGADCQAIQAFISKWSTASGSELANCQSFVTDLCQILGVAAPNPTVAEGGRNTYVFERRVTFPSVGNEPPPQGRIDCYKRECFVLEAKQGTNQEAGAELPVLVRNGTAARRRPKGAAVRGTKGWDAAMARARGQAHRYADAVSREDGWPPFLIVADIGHVIELFADFSRTGRRYAPFPTPANFRIRLADLLDDGVRERLRQVWEAPLTLDPSLKAAKVTQEIAAQLALLARSLEAAGHAPQRVASFLMRCVFTMFAEDVGLLPAKAFTGLLEGLAGDGAPFVPLVRALWVDMDRGSTYSPVIRTKVRHFNGGLFKDAEPLPLDEGQMSMLRQAADRDWADVEPAIFGTLLERALDPTERHKLGAFFTPRSYVERLVFPTIIDPLREDWRDVRVAAIVRAQSGDAAAAVAELRAFHHRLCTIRVLDPACGTGNFLYVTLEHIKRLEGEVRHLLGELSDAQQVLDLDRHAVTPAQFLGIEINPRAAAIADLVLWIGYLQWDIRTRGAAALAEPLLRDYRNIRCVDALLDHDGIEFVRNVDGTLLSRWDGRTCRKHPVTGKDVPDQAGRTEIVRYVNPRPASWPEADYVVGNPPFLGSKRLRHILGDGYVEALRKAHPEVPETVDLVMYWWHAAAKAVRRGQLARFGLITTNSITHSSSRKIVRTHIEARTPLSLVFAIPDHPWVDVSEGAAVRVAMSVAEAGTRNGILARVIGERDGEGAAEVTLATEEGQLQSDFRIGAEVASAVRLRSNQGLSFMGVTLVGEGFRVPEAALPSFDATEARAVIRSYLLGKDLAQRPQRRHLIDLFGFGEDEARARFAGCFQWLLDRVKPEREQNKRASYRTNWWLFGEPRGRMRAALAGCRRYIATPETAKHRFFVFVSPKTIPDHTIFAVAHDDAAVLAVLSSRVHLVWARAAGATLEDRPRWRNNACFDPFPFPTPAPALERRIRALGEELDAFRKARQDKHPELTLTAMYNVMEKLRRGQALTASEHDIHVRGSVGVLRDIHDRLDEAVCEAYGWSETLVAEEMLTRLVALNRQRAEEEKMGEVRWLRPDFQAIAVRSGALEQQLELPLAATPRAPERPQVWPKEGIEQVRLIRGALAQLDGPADAKLIAKAFKGARPVSVRNVLSALVTMGQARQLGDSLFAR